MNPPGAVLTCPPGPVLDQYNLGSTTWAIGLAAMSLTLPYLELLRTAPVLESIVTLVQYKNTMIGHWKIQALQDSPTQWKAV